jgi:hypothetical protein
MPASSQTLVREGPAAAGIVLTVATPDYVDRWRFCIESQKAYCARHGYEYQLHSAALPGLNAKWAKIQYTIDALQRDAAVMLIDADAEITSDAPPFETLLAERPHSDILYALGVSGRLNSGVLVLRPGAGSVATQFLQTCLDERDIPVAPENFVTAEGENGRLIELIAREPFASRAKVIDRAWNCTSPGCYAAAHVRHYTGPLRLAAEEGTLQPPPKGYRKKRRSLGAKLRRLLRV